MNGEHQAGAYAPPMDVRGAGLQQAGDRWGRLAFAAAVTLIVLLYANPAFYWPVLEQARLVVVASSICAFAVLMRRITSGEPLRLGGAPASLLFAYAATVPLSMTWSIAPDRTFDAITEIGKLLVVYVACLNALDSPRRLRTFLVAGAVATLAPSMGAIQRWIENDHLVDGYRTAWRGNYADPNRLAMGLVLLLPAALLMIRQTRRTWLKAVLAFAAVANIAAIVLTHSRSGDVALVVALGFTLLRGRSKGRGLIVAAMVVVGLVTLAPETAWQRSESIAAYGEDASFAGRERAWQMLMVILHERPLTGVGANGFLAAWDRFAPLSAGGEHLIAHNVFMEILGEQGIVALALFGAFMAWLLWRLWFAGTGRAGTAEALALFAGLTAYLICELVNGYARAFNLYAAFAAGMAALQHVRVRATAAETQQRVTAAVAT